MNNAVEKILASVDRLENAIEKAKGSLLEASQDGAADRLESYLGICRMQRRLAGELAGHLAQGSYAELQRSVNLINGLSAMILDDVKVIINGLPAGTTSSFC